MLTEGGTFQPREDRRDDKGKSERVFVGGGLQAPQVDILHDHRGELKPLARPLYQATFGLCDQLRGIPGEFQEVV